MVKATATMASSARANTFAQLVIGPPGSGKTTYCKAMSSFLESIGRKVIVVNVGKLKLLHCSFLHCSCL